MFYKNNDKNAMKFFLCHEGKKNWSRGLTAIKVLAKQQQQQ